MRQLAKIVEIQELHPIKGADLIELAKIDGWQCVVKKGNFQVGSLAVYFEYDSMLPLDDIRFESFAGRNEYEVDGKRYVRIKTMKLKKTLSQGVLIPADLFSVELTLHGETGDDLAELIGVIKYEPKLPAQLSGKARGNFPSFISKTDQERVNNLKREYQESVDWEELFEITYKLDGSSMTAFCYTPENRLGVCSRNLELKTDESNSDNAFVKAFKKIEDGLYQFMQTTGRSIALQGELCGPGIQGNFEGLDDVTFFVYDVFDIDKQQYLLPGDRLNLLSDKFPDVKWVPLFDVNTLPSTIEECLEMANGSSGLNGKYREGLVFKSYSSSFSFKAISTKYLLKEK
jgi:RNA ligase (TIGR02306 family)